MAGQTGRLRRADRLRKHRDFQRVARCGRRAATAYFVLLITRSVEREAGEPAALRLGVTVSRKVGNAVQRNHVKRRIREWFRTSRAQLRPGRDLVVIARRGAADLSLDYIAQSLDEAACRLRASKS